MSKTTMKKLMRLGFLAFIAISIFIFSCTEEKEVIEMCDCDEEFLAPVQTCRCLVFDTIPDTLRNGNILFNENLNMTHQHSYNGTIWESCGYVEYLECGAVRELNFEWTVENCKGEVMKRMLAKNIPIVPGKYPLCNDCDDGYRGSLKFIDPNEDTEVEYQPDSTGLSFIEITRWDTLYRTPFWPQDSSFIAKVEGTYQMHFFPIDEQKDSLPREVIVAKGVFRSELKANIL